MGSKVDDKVIHLMLNGVVLNDRNASLYSLGVKEGSVFELCISDHKAISSILHRKDDDCDIVVDKTSLLCSRILFVEVSGGDVSVSRERAKVYLDSYYDERSVDRVLEEVCGCRRIVSEIEFIVILQSLEHGVKEAFRVPKTLQQLLNVDELSVIPSIHRWEGSESELDCSWVISYDKIQKCVEVLEKGLEEGESVWKMGVNVVDRVGSELDEDKKKEM